MLWQDTIETPVGALTVFAGDEGLRAVLWAREDRDPIRVEAARPGANRVIEAARVQLAEYFDGQRTEFDLPLAPRGTPFQMSAWKVLCSIPFGETITYGEQARRLGDARKARAVGAANGRNLIGIVVPCHRVIGADGSLTGFGGGLDVKRWLIDHESASMDTARHRRGPWC